MSDELLPKNKLNIRSDLQDFWKDERKVEKVERELNKEVEVKKEVTLNFNNYTNSNKDFNIEKNSNNQNFNFKSNYNFEENERYSPKIFFILIGYFIFMVGADIYMGMFFLSWMSWLSFAFIWLYALISIIKNDFKKENLKLIWIILIIFIPFSALLYPDFRKVQIIKD